MQWTYQFAWRHLGVVQSGCDCRLWNSLNNFGRFRNSRHGKFCILFHCLSRAPNPPHPPVRICTCTQWHLPGCLSVRLEAERSGATWFCSRSNLSSVALLWVQVLFFWILFVKINCIIRSSFSSPTFWPPTFVFSFALSSKFLHGFQEVSPPKLCMHLCTVIDKSRSPLLTYVRFFKK